MDSFDRGISPVRSIGRMVAGWRPDEQELIPTVLAETPRLAPALLSQHAFIQVPLSTLHGTELLHFHLHLMGHSVIPEDLDLERLVELECIPFLELFLLVRFQRVLFAARLELLPLAQFAFALKPDRVRGNLHRGAFLDSLGKGTSGKSEQE
jgi:hypothetical protein